MTHAKKERDAIEESKNEAVKFLEWQHKLKVMNAGQISIKKKNTELRIKENEEEQEKSTKLLDTLKEEYEKESNNFKEQESEVKQKENEIKKIEENIEKMTSTLRKMRNDIEEKKVTYNGYEKITEQCKEDQINATKDSTNAELKKKELM